MENIPIESYRSICAIVAPTVQRLIIEIYWLWAMAHVVITSGIALGSSKLSTITGLAGQECVVPGILKQVSDLNKNMTRKLVHFGISHYSDYSVSWLSSQLALDECGVLVRTRWLPGREMCWNISRTRENRECMVMPSTRRCWRWDRLKSQFGVLAKLAAKHG